MPFLYLSTRRSSAPVCHHPGLSSGRSIVLPSSTDPWSSSALGFFRGLISCQPHACKRHTVNTRAFQNRPSCHPRAGTRWLCIRASKTRSARPRACCDMLAVLPGGGPELGNRATHTVLTYSRSCSSDVRSLNESESRETQTRGRSLARRCTNTSAYCKSQGALMQTQGGLLWQTWERKNRGQRSRNPAHAFQHNPGGKFSSAFPSCCGSGNNPPACWMKMTEKAPNAMVSHLANVGKNRRSGRAA